MAVCLTCGRKIGGFSFGSNPRTECRDCREARTRMASAMLPTAAPSTPVDLTGSNAAIAARRLPRPNVTLAFIALNVLVYVAMGLSGASWTEPTTQHALRWGADFGPLSLTTDPWRIFTCMFVHFGIIHIAFNMWCLFDLGRSLEYIMGSNAFAVTYIASGLAASLTSLAWNPWRVSAGASGAIFGVAGAFAAYLFVRKVHFNPAALRQSQKSLAIFIIYNLVHGAASLGVDNSAHIGGLISGFLLGAIIPPMIRTAMLPAGAQAGAVVSRVPIELGTTDSSKENKLVWTVAVASLIALTIAFATVRTKNADAADYGQAVRLIRSGHSDQAAGTLVQVVRTKPDLLFAQLLLGQLFLEQNMPAAAVPPLEQAGNLDPRYVEVLHNLALAYVGTGNSADAEKLIGSALGVETDSKWAALYIRALAEGESGKFAAAVADLRAVLQLRPDMPEAKILLAHFEVLEKQPQQGSNSSAHGAQSESIAGSGANQQPPPIPYSKLLMKSEDWPLFP